MDTFIMSIKKDNTVARAYSGEYVNVMAWLYKPAVYKLRHWVYADFWSVIRDRAQA